MKLVGDIYGDVFDQNPGLLSIPYIDRLARKTKSKALASKIVWTAYQLEDITSPLYHRPTKDRYKLVEENYVKGDFEISEYKEFIDRWPTEMRSKTECLYKMWGDEIDLWFIKMRDLSMDDSKERKERLEIIAKMDKIVKSFESAKKQLEQEKTKLNVRGKARLSKREQRAQKANSSSQ